MYPDVTGDVQSIAGERRQASQMSDCVVWRTFCILILCTVLQTSSQSSAKLRMCLWVIQQVLGVDGVNFSVHVENQTQVRDTMSRRHHRVYQLYSRTSGKHVQVLGRRISAKGEDGDKYGKTQTHMYSEKKAKASLRNALKPYLHRQIHTFRRWCYIASQFYCIFLMEQTDTKLQKKKWTHCFVSGFFQRFVVEH